jgi:drug/metabolite transporter (DMT)-like permease
MEAVLLALLSSLCWGGSDFAGGLLARRLPVLTVLVWAETTGLVVVLAYIAVTGEPFPDARAAIYSVVAGGAGLMGLGAFYRALAIGTMSIVAPIASSGVILPVAVGIASGNRLGPVVAAGLVVTVVGVLLASREKHEDPESARAGRTSVLLALAAAVGFGIYFAGADVAADSSVPWMLALGRAVALPVIAAIAFVGGVSLRPGAGYAAALCATGCLDLSATAFYGVATTLGALSIVSVVGSLYPVVTIILARAFLGERLNRLQAVGVAAALTGVAMIAAG